MKQRSIILFVVVFVLFGLLVSACSGGSKSTASSSGSGSTGDAAAGKTVFDSTCAGCHGLDAKGKPDRGVDLTTSAFVKSTSDADLVTFISTGRPTSDPASKTGRTMPAKGGDPSLTDKDLADIVAYLRTLQK